MLRISGIVIFLAAVYTVTAVSIDHPCFAQSICANANAIEATYFAYQPDDRFYYTCYTIPGIAHFNMGCQQCPPDTFYSAICLRCLSRKNVDDGDCSDPIQPPTTTPIDVEPVTPAPCVDSDTCVNQANGTYQHPSDNTRFYSCVAGAVRECQTCPSGLIYVEVCGSCEVNDTTIASECPETPTGGAAVPKCPVAFCNNRGDGDYESGPGSNTYHTCTEGTCIVMTCPGVLVFAEICNAKCVTQYTNVQSACESNSVSTISPPVILTCPTNFCGGKSTGNHAASTKSQFYYTCVFGNCSPFECPGALYYNPSIDACDFFSNFV